MRVSDFDFELPTERIALRPVEPRDAARMLVVGPEGLSDAQVMDLPTHLRPEDVIIVNDTRVIPARLFGRRDEARIEATLHKQEAADTWRAFVRPAKRLHVGDEVIFEGSLTARIAEKGTGGEVWLAFNRKGVDLLKTIEAVGHMPLPPYIARRRAVDTRDRDDYQSMFAAEEGAVAAPTASLHFTPRLKKAVEDTGAEFVSLTLHVGAGTFLPVTADDTGQHRMHAEFGHLSKAAAERMNAAHARGGRILAVGTTSLRLIEAAAREDGTVAPFEGETDIFITPGYRFKAVDMLMTNFHLPRSTLFMLVCAFAGMPEMKAAYAHAIKAGYRFYSYGDSNLLYRKEGA